MKQNMNDPLKKLTGFTCTHCGKQLIGWISANIHDKIKLCNQCSMLQEWIAGYNKQQSSDQETKESA